MNFRLLQKNNGGVSSARNYGLNNSKGEFVLVLDGDDYISPYFVEVIEKTTKSKKLDIAYWNFEYVPDKDPEKFSSFNIDSIILEIDNVNKILEKFLVSRTLPLWTASIIYSREFLKKNELYFMVGCSNGEDQEFIIKSFVNAQDIYYINEILSFYVQRQGSISNSYNINRFDAINALQRSRATLIKSNELEKKIFLILFKIKFLKLF